MKKNTTSAGFMKKKVLRPTYYSYNLHSVSPFAFHINSSENYKNNNTQFDQPFELKLSISKLKVNELQILIPQNETASNQNDKDDKICNMMKFPVLERCKF